MNARFLAGTAAGTSRPEGRAFDWLRWRDELSFLTAVIVVRAAHSSTSDVGVLGQP